MTDQLLEVDSSPVVQTICDTCGHVYRSPKCAPGMPDLVCSEAPRGTLRELTRPEEILVRRLRELQEDLRSQAQTIRRLNSVTPTQGALV